MSGNLSESICQALDRSEFLIVIVSPETSESAWVYKEICYYCEHHDRDHVLFACSAGNSDQLLKTFLSVIRDKSNGRIQFEEPLAADLTGATSFQRHKLFSAESLRVLSALLGCPYYVLNKREQRYRRQRISFAAFLVIIIAASIIAILLNRNMAIRAQLQETQINESRALSALSELEFRDGNYNGAIQYALNALPMEGNDRPYVSDAEYTLSEELYLYQNGILAYDQSFEQDTNVSCLALSENGEYVATGDRYGCVRVYNAHSGDLLWGKNMYPITSLCFLDEYDAVFVNGLSTCSLLNISTGDVLWERDNISFGTISIDQTMWLTYQCSDAPGMLRVMDLKDGSLIQAVSVPDYFSYSSVAEVFSDDGSFAAIIVENGSEASIYIFDLRENVVVEIYTGLFYSAGTHYRLAFTQDNDLIVSYDAMSDGAEVLFLEHRNEWICKYITPIVTEEDAQRVNGVFSIFGSIDLFECNNKYIAVGSKHYLYMIDIKSGEIIWEHTLVGSLVEGCMYDSGALALVLSNGIITLCTPEGVISYSQGIYFFECGYDLARAAIQGKVYKSTTFAVVSNGHRNRIAMVQFLENKELTQVIGANQISRNYDYYSSPSGQVMALLTYDYEVRALVGLLLDVTTDNSIESFMIPIDTIGTYDQRNVILTDDKKVIANGVVFDLTSSKVYGLTKTGDLPALYLDYYCTTIDKKEHKVLSAVFDKDYNEHDSKYYYTLHIWEDDVLLRSVDYPLTSSSYNIDCKCLAIGANGYVLAEIGDPFGGPNQLVTYSLAQDQWKKLSEIYNTGGAYCLANCEPYLAIQDRDGIIQVINLESGKLQTALFCGEAHDSVSKVMFASDDSILIVFTSAGVMNIFDVSTAELLHTSSYGNLNLRFHENARYDVFIVENQNRMLIIYDDSYYTESACICIETENWDRVGQYSGVVHFLEASQTMVVKPYVDGLYYSPFLTLDDIIAKGLYIVSGHME